MTTTPATASQVPPTGVLGATTAPNPVASPGYTIPAVSPPGYTIPALHTPVPGSTMGVGYLNPYLPPYLLPGASQQATVQVPYRCEVDHQHPPRSSCSTAKRKLTIFDLEVHMRYTTAAHVTIDDVIAGSLSLLESMLRQGVDCTGYVRHVRFLVEKSKIYLSSALIGYDTEMRERAEIFSPGVFSYGDHDLTHRWLGVESLKPSTSSSAVCSKAEKKKSKFTKFGSCWLWNDSKPCKNSPCKYKHICSNCQGDHKVLDCSSKSSSTSSFKNK